MNSTARVRLCSLVLLLLLAGSARAQEAYATVTTRADATAIASENAAMATATALALIEPVEHFQLQRPIEISADTTHWIERTYPYGSTQLGARPVHLGVEFVNKRGTPALAAAAGSVIFAGGDQETLIGPRLDYYGNLVILRHDLRSLDDLEVFTLYAHLQRIDVAAGETVAAGDQLGTVGSSGAAIGAHLHFELRVGDPFDYLRTRNPALWLRNYPGRGLIAGFVHDASGAAIMGKRVVIRSEATRREVHSYGGDEVNGDPVWGENFSAGDLRAGDYEIVVLKENGAIGYRETVELRPDAVTFVDILIED